MGCRQAEVAEVFPVEGHSRAQAEAALAVGNARVATAGAPGALVGADALERVADVTVSAAGATVLSRVLTTATIRRNLRILGDRQASGRELARAFGIT